MNNFNCYKTTEVKKCVLTLISSFHFTIFPSLRVIMRKILLKTSYQYPDSEGSSSTGVTVLTHWYLNLHSRTLPSRLVTSWKERAYCTQSHNVLAVRAVWAAAGWFLY